MKKWIMEFVLIAMVCLFVGCTVDETDSSSSTGGGSSSDAPANPPSYTDLPSNPSVPANPSGTSRQLWYFGYKSYDNTFRIRWPTYFATDLGVGPGSFNLVDGQRAEFRSFDTDNNSKRPSYTIPGPKSRFSGSVICILFSAGGTPLAWFEANAGATTQGSLP